MNHKKKMKLCLDILMTIVLLFLMALQVTEDKYHEWLGAGMLLMFLLHHILNWGWYKSVFKGKYTLLRLFRTILNIAVLISIILTGYSGIVMSRYVFAFLPIEGGMATARKLHLAGSYWSFVLMSIHLGMHWSMLTGKILGKSAVLWLLRIIAFSMAIYGAILFGRYEIFRNMFLQNDFATIDFETPGFLIIVQNLAMMSMWIWVGHYLKKALEKLSVLGR